MKQQFLISDSERKRILNLHESVKDNHGTSPLNESPDDITQVPSDTTGYNSGNNLRIYSRQANASNTYKLKVSFSFLSKKPTIEDFDLDEDELYMKVKLPYGTGNSVERALKEAPLWRYGVKYRMIEGSWNESDRVVITIDTTSDEGKDIVLKALNGDRYITVIDEGKTTVELIKV